MSTNGATYATNGAANGSIIPPTPKYFKPLVDLPHIVALVKTTGEMANSRFGESEVKLALTNGQLWYVAQPVADKIRTSGIQPQQQLEVTKTGKGPMDWQIIPLQAHLGGAPAAPQNAAGTALAAAPTPQPIQQTQNSATVAPSVNAATARFVAAYKSAVDVLLEAKTYAQGRGLALEIRCDDVRCLAATMMIHAEGGRK